MTYKKEKKYRPTKLDPEYIKELSFLQEMGDEKHKDNHWTNGVKVSEVVDGIKRHIACIERGEFVDPESGIPHSSAAGVGCMYLSHYIRNDVVFGPFFDLPFAGKCSTVGVDSVPGSYTPGRPDKVPGRGSGVIQKSGGPA